jgi:hypothetical protein
VRWLPRHLGGLPPGIWCVLLSGCQRPCLRDDLGRSRGLVPDQVDVRHVVSALVERALRVLDNERLIPRLRVGMTRADVLAEVGGDWRARPALGRPVRFFEAEDIPVQLVVDERDLVVEARPWPFI